jgi:ketosteroid isomerase-like protein
MVMKETSLYESEIQAFIAHFLSAFENLDMPAFIACFRDTATAFFPSPEPPLRVSGKADIQRRFEIVFTTIRQNATAGPPFHQLPACDVLVQSISPETAVVTFHLLNAERTARRTLVLIKSEGSWHIVHLHASNAPAMPI